MEENLKTAEKLKNGAIRFSLRLACTMISAVIIGVASSYVTTMISLDNLATRVSHIEKKVLDEKLSERTIALETAILRHEQALERDFGRYEQMVFELAHKTDDQEKRLTRLETLVSETQRLLAEISADVKSLLRARK